MVLSAFGFLLIIGSLVARDEMLAAAQKREFRTLLAAWEESHCPPPGEFLPAISPGDRIPKRKAKRAEKR